MAERLCPQCKIIPLDEKTLSDKLTRIDVCAECRGGWFDATELDRVLSTAVKDLDPPKNAQTSGRSCPNCNIHLLKFLYPETEIEVDVCSNCSGVWLDRGEFRGINEARARFQDKQKMSDKEIDMLPKPKTFKDAVVSFIDKMMIKWDVV